MDFALTAEQKLVQETIGRFLARQCPREAVRAADDRGEFPAELLGAIAELGFCGLSIPEEYAGFGDDLVSTVLVIEALAGVYPVLAGAVATTALSAAQGILALGSPEQKQRLLPGLATAETLVALSLPEGDDVAVSAAPAGDGFVLSGAAAPVAFAAEAAALVAPVGAAAGAAAFCIIDLHAPGVSLRPAERMGFRGAGVAAVHLDQVRVAAADLLGGPAALGQADRQQAALRAGDDLARAAVALGLARGAGDYAAQYARERVQFGRPIIAFEAMQHMLVTGVAATEAARLLVYRAAWLAAAGQSYAAAAALARYQAEEAARQAALGSLQILGGYGYTMEYDAQRYVRDALSLLGGNEPAARTKSRLGALLDFQGKIGGDS